ncbi:hypothetical protein [Bradyrhizobium genosp. A]|uniref:hypothetical protein n=1 Tax=Bradyrhizobium genosp. A TaxID=83626 RepID=UPI003CF4BB48
MGAQISRPDVLWVAVKALGGELIEECRPELFPLIENMQIADQIVPRRLPLPAANFHCYICSLPGLFTKDYGSIPNLRYLTAPKNRAGKLAPLLGAAGDRLKIGIVWSGSVTFGKNHRRAQRLLSFFQACALPGVQLYNLQKGLPADRAL